MLQSNPKAFENDNTTFDKLVRMQHHGLPTRLLDVTSNPLVALFFACNQSAKSDGKILLFSPKKNEILFPSEISRLALAGVESGLNVIELFYSIIDEIKKEDNNFLSIILLAWAFNEYQNESATPSNEIDENEEKKKENVNELMEEISKCIDELEEMKRSMVTIGFESRISEISKRRKSAYEKFKNKMLSIEPCLINETSNEEFPREDIEEVATRAIRKISEKYDFYAEDLDSINKELSKFYFVPPPLNSEIIQRQRGAFLVFPIKETTKNDMMFNITYPYKIRSCTIPGKLKKSIIRELDSIGINEEFLFPGLDSSAKRIKEACIWNSQPPI
jgi:hypothetical protein